VRDVKITTVCGGKNVTVCAGVTAKALRFIAAG
jgi:hypothetical protein